MPMSATNPTLTPNPVLVGTGIVCAPDSPIADVMRACARIAASDATVLLTGETGTGKEVFARMVHQNSPRAKRTFVPVNCAAIPDALLESELFGYVRGAFTGAVTARRGRVAMAEGGTLFLDEIGDLPLTLQVKLLRLLQHHTYEPVGSSESVQGNFRLVAATNRDLGEDVRAGRFRHDLYYRLHVCPLMLPPLRERRADIAPLFFHFWQLRGERRPVAPAVIHQLEGYAWPGNVRELENLAERLSVCSEGHSIGLADLPRPFLGEGAPRSITPPPFDPGLLPSAGTLAELAERPREAPHDDLLGDPRDGAREEVGDDTDEIALDSSTDDYAPPLLTPLPSPGTLAGPADEMGPPSAPPPSFLLPEPRLPVDLPRLLREAEEAYIKLALDQAGGNKKEAARLLGMGRTTLVEKLRRKAALACERA